MEDILRKLVGFPTISGNAQASHELLRYVAGFVAQRDMHVEWHESNGFESLVATVVPGKKTPKVMLAAHADVVSAPDELFELRKVDGRYFGRGVLDMKFAIATYMQIIDELYQEGNLANYDIGIVLTTDEEVGGINGVAKLIDDGYIPSVCVLPDGGDNWQIQTGSKGILLYEISIEGKAAHGARPWLGDNALTKLIGVLDEIAALFPREPSTETNTISLTGMSGGQSVNQIPAIATMTLDIRMTDSSEYARLHSEIGRICDKWHAEHRVKTDGVPTKHDLNDPLIAPYAELIEKTVGVKQNGFLAMGSSDARFFVPYGTPCLMVYPEGGGSHSDDEWLEVKALRQFKDITKRYLAEVAQQHP